MHSNQFDVILILRYLLLKKIIEVNRKSEIYNANRHTETQRNHITEQQRA